ncbi:hypothetical protein TNCV_4195201 [Trichonephila clavipes]|nr:hypothetical protein TNCV_4195201 [Trichonephila clavipes]
MITNCFIPELNNHDVQELGFQQDGATCHTARATIDLLKDTISAVEHAYDAQENEISTRCPPHTFSTRPIQGMKTDLYQRIVSTATETYIFPNFLYPNMVEGIFDDAASLANGVASGLTFGIL